MSDMLCCFFVLLSYYHYFRYREHGHWRFMVFLTGAATAAFFTRYAAVPLLIPPLLAGFTLVFRSRRVALKIAAVLFLSAAVELILWSSDRFFAVGIDIWKQWSWENVFALQAEEESGVLLRTVPNGLYIFGNFFHIGFLAIGTLLLPFYRQVLREKVVWFGSLLYLALLVGLSTQNYRFLMVLHPLVLLLLFPAFRGKEAVIRVDVTPSGSGNSAYSVQPAVLNKEGCQTKLLFHATPADRMAAAACQLLRTLCERNCQKYTSHLARYVIIHHFLPPLEVQKHSPNSIVSRCQCRRQKSDHWTTKSIPLRHSRKVRLRSSMQHVCFEKRV